MQNTLQRGDLRPKKFTISSFLLRNRNLIIEIVSAFYILLFVYTGINKLMVFEDLQFVLKDYPLIGNFYKLVAWGVPISELLIAVLLFSPKTKRWGLVFSAALMSVFTLYLIYIINFAPKLPCTCGGMLQKLSWPQHLVFNIFFIALAAVAIWLHKKQKKHKEESESTPIVFT